MNLDLTEHCITLRIRRLILFHSVSPPCVGVRWWDPRRAIDRQRVWYFGQKA